MNGIYLSQPHKQISATVALLRHIRAFIRQTEKTQMRSPFDPFRSEVWDRAQAQRELTALVNTAINRKARTQPRGRKDHREWWYQSYRDQQALRRRITQRVRVYRLETKEARRRFAHLLCDPRDG